MVGEHPGPNKYAPPAKRARHHRSKSTRRRLPRTKMWSQAYSSRNIWALYGPHLTFKAWRDSRSRQENRYGRHAVHIMRGLAPSIRGTQVHAGILSDHN